MKRNQPPARSRMVIAATLLFGVLIAIMVFRPTGLLGQQLAERA